MSLGFGRLKLSAGSKDDLEEGSIIFHGGQKERIVNLDETDGNLDNTKGKRGGQPPLVFYGKDIAGSSTAASKASYTPTIICGANAAGEAIPLHFQLKSTAKTSKQEKVCCSLQRCLWEIRTYKTTNSSVYIRHERESWNEQCGTQEVLS